MKHPKHKSFVDKSIGAALSAIEVYNKPVGLDVDKMVEERICRNIICEFILYIWEIKQTKTCA